jgi:hypothetical protein
MSLDAHPESVLNAFSLHYCLPSIPSRQALAELMCGCVQSSEFDANGGTSKQSTVMFGGKPDVSRMSIWSVKCALPLPLPSPKPLRASLLRDFVWLLHCCAKHRQGT